jgi:hypothetical protein
MSSGRPAQDNDSSAHQDFKTNTSIFSPESRNENASGNFLPKDNSTKQPAIALVLEINLGQLGSADQGDQVSIS